MSEYHKNMENWTGCFAFNTYVAKCSAVSALVLKSRMSAENRAKKSHNRAGNGK